MDGVVVDELVADHDRRLEEKDGREAMLQMLGEELETTPHAGLVQLKMAAAVILILGDGLRTTRRV